MDSIQYIQLPKRQVPEKSADIVIPSFANSNGKKYDIEPGICYFDPNTAGSPPNLFMNNLKMRMDKYYNTPTKASQQNHIPLSIA